MIGYDCGQVWAVFGALFAFGFVYDLLVGWLERKGYAEGFTAILVVVGVAATLAGVAVIDFSAALLALGAFIAAGFWMILGSFRRYALARREEQRRLLEEGRADDWGEAVAE